jgi:hypothetical protein
MNSFSCNNYSDDEYWEDRKNGEYVENWKRDYKVEEENIISEMELYLNEMIKVNLSINHIKRLKYNFISIVLIL